MPTDLDVGGRCPLRQPGDGSSAEGIYREERGPGTDAFALSGDRLVLLRNADSTYVYDVANAARPRRLSAFDRTQNWVALAGAPSFRRFYALDRSGALQAYRLDDTQGFVPTSDVAHGRPSAGYRLAVTSDAMVVCGTDGTVQLDRATGASLKKVADVKVGEGTVWPIGEDLPTRGPGSAPTARRGSGRGSRPSGRAAP